MMRRGATLGLLILPMLAGGVAAQQGTGTLEIRFPDLPSCTHPVRVAVHANARQMAEEEAPLAAKVLVPQPGQCADARLSLPGLPHGSYVIAAYQDMNGNGRLDRNWLGAPAEPWGVSNDPRPARRAPSFEEGRIAFAPGAESVILRLR